MEKLKYILSIPFIIIVVAGCNSTIKSNNDMVQTPIEEKKKEIKSEAIVLFQKGTSVKNATEIIVNYKMQVLKVYETLSKHTQKPMLHIRASLPMDKLLELLQKNPKIISISPNYRRELKSK